MSEHRIVHFFADGLRLTGTLHLPSGQRPPVVIGCHGLLADRSSPKQIALAEALNRIGIAYFRFDHRGCGDSQGTIDESPLLASRCSDLYHAIEAMKTDSSLSHLLGLFGSSFGGTVALATAAEHPVPVLISYAAPIRSSSISPLAVNDIQRKTGGPDARSTAFVFDIGQKINRLKNVLVLHSNNDEVVPVDHANEIYQTVSEPKDLVIFDNGDHRMTNPAHQSEFIRHSIAWYSNR